MRAALGLCAFLIVGPATAGGAAAQAGPSAPVPEWFVRVRRQPDPGRRDFRYRESKVRNGVLDRKCV